MQKSKNIRHLIVHIILLAGVTITITPFLWMVFTSFKTLGESMAIPPTIFPKHFQLDAYKISNADGRSGNGRTSNHHLVLHLPEAVY